MDQLTAPKIDQLLSCFEDSYLSPTLMTPKLAAAMEPLFTLMSDLSPLSRNNEAKSIWLKIPRGGIGDYDCFEDLKEYGEVETYEEFEYMWKEEYPDAVCWYELMIVESFNRDGSLFFRAVRLGDNTVISAITEERNVETENFPEDAAIELCNLIIPAVSDAMEKIRKGTYNMEVEAELPYQFRNGVIRRAALWERDPENKVRSLDGLSMEKIEELRNLLPENDVMRIGRLSSMTANDFYNACSIGYKACGYEDDGLSPIDQYYRHADGRDEGLSSRGQGVSSGPGIDPDSSDAWDEWFFDRERFGGHPWEVCRGGSFTHLSLFVMHDRDELEWKIQSTEISAEESEKHPNGYYFIVAGTHRIFEAVNFYTALRKAGLPVLLSSGNEILARLDGTDYVGIVSLNSTWRDFEEIIPESYEPVIDFMHVYNEEMEKFGNQIEWIPEEPARLIKK